MKIKKLACFQDELLKGKEIDVDNDGALAASAEPRGVKR
jgi:hypothetical protein